MLENRFMKMLGLVLLLLALSAIPSKAQEPNYRIVDNVLIYLGVVPAAMIAGKHPGETEELMHGGVPTGLDEYHVLVALFDAKTSERISSAQVSVSTALFGMARETKNLEPMTIENTLTFGNFFKMKGTGTYRIDVAIRIPGRPAEIKARFEYSHQ